MGFTVGIVSGGFDPLHSGHLSMIEVAASECDYLYAAVNSDEWLIRKKGAYFLPYKERAAILRRIEGISGVIEFDDTDDSASDAIAKCLARFPNAEIRFFNGGDRNSGNILELIKFSSNNRVSFHFGIGGETKLNSSSDILKSWMQRVQCTTPREWGSYDVLREYKHTKLKTLTVAPGKALSMQRHIHRSEHWFVVQGTGRLTSNFYDCPLTKHQDLTIDAGAWHKLHNTGTDELIIIEVQFGEVCDENDIERSD